MAGKGASRLAAELTGATTPGARPRCWVESGTVKAVVEGYDNDTTITVTWRGVDVPCSYLGDYTPAADDVVLMLVQPPSLICLGKLIGPTVEDDD